MSFDELERRRFMDAVETEEPRRYREAFIMGAEWAWQHMSQEARDIDAAIERDRLRSAGGGCDKSDREE